MPKSVQAVFHCHAKTEPTHAGGPVQAKLAPRYGDEKGNRFLNDFAKGTPSGELTLWIDNPSAAEAFEVGGYYDLVIARRESPEQG